MDLGGIWMGLLCGSKCCGAFDGVEELQGASGREWCFISETFPTLGVSISGIDFLGFSV